MTALGDFSPGDVLTAADMNAIGELTSYTPNFRPASGSWGSTYANYGQYTVVNEVVIGFGRVYINNAGTGANGILFDLPVAANTGFASIGAGRESALTGWQFSAFLSSSTVGSLRFYNNGDTATGSGWDFPIFFMYRAA